MQMAREINSQISVLFFEMERCIRTSDFACEENLLALHSPVDYLFSVIEFYGDTVRVRAMLDIYCPHGSYIQSLIHIHVLGIRWFMHVHKELAVRYQCYSMQNRFKVFVI